MTTKCNLCLFQCPPSSVESDDLRRLIDRIFYFRIFRGHDEQTLVCNSCTNTVQEFYNYAENVWRNQQFLRDSSVPSSSNVPVAIHSEADLQLELQNNSKIVKIEKLEEEEDDHFEAKAFLETSYQDVNMAEDTDDGKTNPEWNTPEAADDTNSDEPEEAESESAEDDDYEPKTKSPSKNPKATTTKTVTKTANSSRAMVEEQLLQQFKLSCDLCSIPLADFSELMKHFKRVHNQQAYIKCCNKKIQRKYWIIEHLQVHLNPDTFRCEICKKSYTSSRVLKEHIKEVHTPTEERAIKCQTCHKSFATQRALSSHLLASHGSVPCPQCFKVLASQGSLKKHMLMMHGEGEQYVCDTCARVFRSKPCFEKHIKMHLGTFEVDRVQCEVCLAWLTDKNCLKKHVRRVHTSQDEVVNCEECGRPQRNQIMLKAHMARAHGESRFQCEICLKRFKRSYHMREHKAIHHTGEDLYGCDYCPERFNNKNKQCLHRKMYHPVEYEEEQRRRTGAAMVPTPAQQY